MLFHMCPMLVSAGKSCTANMTLNKKSKMFLLNMTLDTPLSSTGETALRAGPDLKSALIPIFK